MLDQSDGNLVQGNHTFSLKVSADDTYWAGHWANLTVMTGP